MTKQFTKVKAIFKPSEEYIDSLRPEAKVLIGKELSLMYSWLMGEDDPFPNIWALTLLDRYDDSNLGWIPEFDLEIIEYL